MSPPKASVNPSVSLIELNLISFSYGIKPVIKEVVLNISQGEFIGVIGPNGSGKSTLLKLMNGILKPDRGHITFRDRTLESIKRKELAQSIAWIPQENQLAFSFKVMDVVLMGRHPYLAPLTFENEEDLRITQDALKLTDTQPFVNRSFNEISGGEKQRVMIASAISQEPEIMMLDEPTSYLDIKYQIEILNILRRLNQRENLTLILALHDLNLASKYCNRLILLHEGQVVKDGPPNLVLQKNILETVYGIQVKIFKDEDDGSFVISPR